MKYAVCNELFGELPLAESARIIKKTGYEGIEFAPFTVFGDFSPAAVRAGIAEIRKVLDGEGLTFAGFHWLLLKPEGLHITTPDPALRRRSWDHIRLLLDSAAELGGGPLILGSPRQRSSTGGATAAQALALLTEELARVAPYAAGRGSAILLEALTSAQSDIVNTLAKARAVIEAVGSPGVSGLFDFHNTGDEKESWRALVLANAAIIRHVHANETDGELPGTGSSDFAPATEALMEVGYTGWISMEIFSIPVEPAAGLAHARELFRFIEDRLTSGFGGPILTRQGGGK